ITKYASMAGLPNVPIQVVLLDGFNGIPVVGETLEISVDIEMAISMAPGLSNLVVFEAPNRTFVNDVLIAMTARPEIKQFSSSTLVASAGLPPSATSDNIFKQMALQGQSFFEISGDGDS